MEKNLKLITFLAITVILALAIYSQHKIKPSTDPAPSPSPQPKLLSDTLTPDEKFILNPPPADASRSAKKKHAEVVAKLAKETPMLEIKNCQPNPLVLQIKQGSEFKIKNYDTVERRIFVDGSHVYKIPAKGEQNIKAEFKYGTGDYGYVCEGVGLVAFLHVVQQLP